MCGCLGGCTTQCQSVCVCVWVGVCVCVCVCVWVGVGVGVGVCVCVGVFNAMPKATSKGSTVSIGHNPINRELIHTAVFAPNS